MTELQLAMQRVDAVGGAGAPFRPVIVGPDEQEAPLQEDAIEAGRAALARAQEAHEAETAAEVAAEAKTAANRAVIVRSLARTFVSLCAEIGGHDPRYSRPSDTITADNVEALGMSVVNAKAVELPAAFRQISDPADIAKSEAISNALKGTEP